MQHISKRIFFLCSYVILITTSLAIEARDLPQPFDAANSQGVKVTRNSTTLYFDLGADVKSPITIPRLAAPLRSMSFIDPSVKGDLKLVPLQDTWEIHWKERPKGSGISLWLQFDAMPKLPSELRPIHKAGDGSFFLPAHLATTTGEKIRYEPQTHKNTVGFWAGKNDTATWTFKLDKPGRFNVAVLQGCGKGQGGSQATMSFVHPDKDDSPTVDFEVVETGHWQNFQWVQLGQVELQNKGEVQVVVKPNAIKKAALMDIRAIHLIRLPDKK